MKLNFMHKNKPTKITLRLVRYFIATIAITIAICFIISSIFLSKLFMNQQYNFLESTAKDIQATMNNNSPSFDSSVTALLIEGDSITPLGKGKMGMIQYLRNMDYKKLSEKGKFKNPMGEEFLFYKLSISQGYIFVFQSNKYSSNYLKIAYIILLSVFILAFIVSTFFISYFGKKFTEPILELQQISREIENGNFNVDINMHTDDEIEDLSNSIRLMAASLGKKYSIQREFIANVSHDFKTPLSIIRNYSEAIKDGLLDINGTQSYAEDIINEVDRLNFLVKQVLQLSKLQGGSYKLEKESFDLKSLLEQCISSFKAVALAKNICINLKSVNCYVTADFNNLSRVLYNFIDNAIKFSHINSRIDIISEQTCQGVKVSVIDYGCGIEESILEDIWHRYYKHEKSGGIGLGLAICSEILDLHGFQYGVTSSANKQTEFYFIIPKEQNCEQK